MKKPKDTRLHCFDCETGRLDKKRKHPVPHDVFGVRFVIHDRVYVCDTCGAVTIGWERLRGHGFHVDRAYRKAIGAPDGKTLRKRRKQLGLNRADLAAMIGVDEEKIRRWEHGMVFSPEDNARLKQALGL